MQNNSTIIKCLIDNPNQDTTLRQYQIDSKSDIFKTWETTKSILFQMPTGTGKTRLFASIIKDIREMSVKLKIIPQPRILVLAHRTELIEQISNTLQNKYHIICGIIKSGFLENADAIVQVASVQSLSRRLERWSDCAFQYIIIDEAHHALASTYMKVCKTFPNAHMLGVTATPYRLSGESFRKLFGKLITSMPVQKFIEQGYLSDFNYYSIPINSQLQFNIDNISKFGTDGDYLERELIEICDNHKIRAKLVKSYLTYANGKRGIVYTINKQHNRNVANQYREQGLRVADIDSDTPAEERQRIVREFKIGNIDIICNVNIFSEGFDCPDLEFVQLARPTQSLSLYLQQVGRALRIAEHKSRAIILDNVGIYNKFGLPNKPINWFQYFNFSECNALKISAKHFAKGQRMLPRKIEENDENMVLIEGKQYSEEITDVEKYNILGIISSMEQYPIGMDIDSSFKLMMEHFYPNSTTYEFLVLLGPTCYNSLDSYVADMEEMYGIDEDGEVVNENSDNGRALFYTYRYEYNNRYGVCRLKRPFSNLTQIKNIIASISNPKFTDYFDVIIDPIYDSLEVPNNCQNIIFCIDCKYGIMNAYKNTEIAPCIYDEIDEIPQLGYIVAKNGKYGVIMHNGVFKIPLIYDDIIPVDLNKKLFICLKNGKFISLIDSTEIYKMTDIIGQLTEKYFVSKFNISDYRGLIYSITNKEGEILFPTFADYIFINDNSEICFQYKSRCIYTDMNLNYIKTEKQETLQKHLLPDFYFKPKVKNSLHIESCPMKPKENSPLGKANIQSSQIRNHTFKTTEEKTVARSKRHIKRMANLLEKQIDIEKQANTETNIKKGQTDNASTKKKRPRIIRIK